MAFRRPQAEGVAAYWRSQADGLRDVDNDDSTRFAAPIAAQGETSPFLYSAKHHTMVDIKQKPKTGVFSASFDPASDMEIKIIFLLVQRQ